jgi:alcohol dehydrogenase class IV
MHQQIYFENDIELITNEIMRLQPQNILIVADFASYETSGAKALVDLLFGRYTLIFFKDFTVNPIIEDLEKGINLYRDTMIDMIVAIGGGSVIDMAKLIKSYMNINIDLRKAIKSNQIFPVQNVPLIAIPTTAGSGSESTHFAVIYINGCKYSVSDISIRPNYVLLVFSLTSKCPPYLTACSGSDALCQAIESYWSVQSTEESRNYAKEAILLLWKYLPQAVVNDLNARRNVMIAANLAGRAINISFTTAAHAYSYGLTVYAGIPHGHAVSLTLPFFFDLNMNVSADNCIDQRGAEFVKERMNELLSFLNCKAENVKEKLSSFFKLLFGNKNKEAIAGITDDIRTQLSLSVNLQRLQNNPVKISKEDIENIKFR